jgi:hypothetical protein
MKGKFIYIFWGIVFFLAGLGLLVGYIDIKHLSQQVRFWTLTIASATFILSYFLDGVRKWGWLFPAIVCATLAVDLGLEINGISDSSLMAGPILAGLALVFYIGFAVDRKRWGWLIPAYILTFAAINVTVDSMIAHSILSGDTQDTILLAFTSGAGVMFLLALPFFIGYFWSKKNWWAIIPAGSFTSLGLVVLLQYLMPAKQNTLIGLFGGVLLLGLGATFAILWLRRKTQPTEWAKYPAAGLFVLAILTFILGNGWNTLSDQGKAIAFAVASAVCLICYFIHGLKKWGWLFPALICAAMAFTMWMSINDMEDSPFIIGSMLVSVAIPFYVGFALNRKQRGLLIPAVIATLAMIFFLIADSDLGQGAGVMFLFALPFFVVYFWSKKNWWAFIPAGAFAIFGLVTVLEILIPHKEFASLPNTLSWDVYSWVLFLGFAATFGVLWLRRKTQPTDWTKYPALGFLAIAILSFILGERFQEFWLAAVMLVIGGMFLMATSIKKIPMGGQQTPEIKA